jgi:glutathione S-transferase
MKLFGTTTSPYVRRVRIVCAELGVRHDLVDTATADGQAALRLIAPLWKVPAVVVGDQIIFDSGVICEWLFAHRGYGPLRVTPAAERWRAANLVKVIDGALDAAINTLYLEREGVDVAAVPYAVKQRERVASALGWIERELRGGYFTGDLRLGVPELALVSALDWMVFRDRYPVRDHPGLTAFLAAHAGRPSVRDTYPHA